MSEFDGEANENGVNFATALFRLLRSGQMHEVQSLRAQGALDTAAGLFRDATRKAGGFITLLFAGDTVFANGQPVRSSRAVYENILATAPVLANRAINEVTIRTNVTGADLGVLIDFVVHGRKVRLPASLTLQYVDPAKILDDAEDSQTIQERVAATYAAATVLVRRCEDQIRDDSPRLLRHVKRVAQRMVTLSREGFVEWLALARRPAAPTDHASIAVNAAVIGALAGRALTDDIHTLLRITMGALQAEIGKPRVAGMYRSDSFQTAFVPQLNQAMRKRLPSSTALLLLQAGRASEQPMMRAIVAYETAHLADGALLGWPYDGTVPPTVESVIASLAARVANGIANAGNPDDLVRMLAEIEIGKIERAGLDLIYSVLGLLPAGTPVEMSTGWRGVILSAGDRFDQLERPHVVLLLDSGRRVCDPQVTRANESAGWVRSVVTRTDELLEQQYERWLRERVDDGLALPSHTGILEPDHTDSIKDRASLAFDPDEATNVLDAGSIARALPRQFQSTEPTSIPKQFQSRDEVDNVPAQVLPDEPRSLPRQFQQPAQETIEPKAAVPGAWVKPRKPKAPDEPPAEPKQDADSKDDEDDDFDALANIVLFD